MTITEKQLERMQELVDTLNRASDAYYNGKDEIMPNYEWDAFLDELEALECETGHVLENSPTQKVSEDNIEGEKEEHEFPALSLAKTKILRKFAAWMHGLITWLSFKLDGCTLVATYDDGKLTKLVTRGDGLVGTNITYLAAGFFNLPLVLKSSTGHMVVRGEAVMTYEDFEAMNLEVEEPYANPRNLVAGSLTLKSVDELKRRNIKWIPFTLVYTDLVIKSWGERMDYLESLGFEVVKRVCCHTEDELLSQVQVFTDLVESGKYAYPVDGLVEAYDDTEYAAGGSVTGHHATRAGYALKWQDESVHSTLKYIEWSCAAQSITPVGVFEPVALEGTTVQRASLANISECRRLGIGGPGTEIEVIKANKIIPKIVKVTNVIGKFEIPEKCPVCGSFTQVFRSASGAETLRCLNVTCPAKELRKFARYVSKDGVNIKGLSMKTLQKFVQMGWLHDLVDFYQLDEHFDELREMPGFGKRSVTKLEAAIEKSRTVDSKHFLYGLSIPMVGHDVAKRLLSVYCLKDLMKEATDAGMVKNYKRFSDIPGIGPEKSAAFVSWCGDVRNMDVYKRLRLYVNVTDETVSAVASKDDSLVGMTFVITGSLNHYANRKALQEEIESKGGKASGSVTSKTSYLINNDVNSTSSKNKKAMDLGIPIITEDEFLEKFGKV